MAEVKSWRTDQKCLIKILDSDDPEDITKDPKCRKCGQPHFMIIPRVIPIELKSDSLIESTPIHENKIPTLLESVNKLIGGIN